ncbi:hypothetical protein C0Q70_04788 [Pomacea canaliculata]|uniref:Poly [ADP-ribose] polymerase n=2 Tax=Pomacea canaliculata TaxID=400727 RepID=A0A2T7PJG9_POMCA|nr:hypothetical protein C0Q70_04788 [Pomacea canaliculata]
MFTMRVTRNRFTVTPSALPLFAESAGRVPIYMHYLSFKCLLTTDDDRTNGISVQNKDTESTQKRKLLPVATMDCDSWTEENTENSSLGQETKRRKSTDDDLDLEETEDDVYIKILFGIHNQDLVQEDDRDTDEVCDTEDISSASSIAEKESAKPQQVSRDVSLDDNKADRNVPNQDYKHKEKLGVIQGEDYAQNVEENTEQKCFVSAPEFEVAATSVDDHIDLNEMDKDASIQSCAEEEKEDVIDVSEFQQRLQLCGKCSSLIGRDSFAQCRDAGEARKVLPYIVMELLKEKSEKETFKLISDMDMMVLSPKEIGFRLINSNSSQKYCQICKKDLYQFSHVSCGSKTTQEWSPVSAPRYWAPFPPNFQQLLTWHKTTGSSLPHAHSPPMTTAVVISINNNSISKRGKARQHMVDDFGKGQLNEKLLFHGTEATFAHDICSEGFDWRLCGRNGTVYGKGCYFAKHASYSLKFSDRNEEKASGEYLYAIKYTRTLALSVPAWLQSAKTLFVARVLCGRTVAGNSTMTKPPIDSGDPKQRPYNSACDNTTNPSMYVVFDSAQAYPAYGQLHTSKLATSISQIIKTEEKMLSKACLVALVTLQWSALALGYSVYACEGDMLVIQCYTGQVSSFLPSSAANRGVYSRKSTSTPLTTNYLLPAKLSIFAERCHRCGDNFMLQKMCKTDATQYMRYRCEGRFMCEVLVDTATFLSDPCPDVLKYMEVEYQCVPPTSFASVDACVEKCMATGGNPCSASIPAAGLNQLQAQPQPQLQPQPQIQPQPSVPLSALSVGAQQASSTKTGQQPALSQSRPSPASSSSSSSSSSAAAASHSHFSAVPALPYGSDKASSNTGTSGGTGSSSLPMQVPGSLPARLNPAAALNMNSATRAALMARLGNVLASLQNRAG